MPLAIGARYARLRHALRHTAFAGEFNQVRVGARSGANTLNTESGRRSPMNSKLYVGNMSFETTEADLRGAFEQFGTVTEVQIASDRYTGRPRGFAFVTFSSEEESKAAAEKLNGVELNTRQLTVNPARPAGDESAGTRTFSSPNRRAGAFHTRGKRRR